MNTSTQRSVIAAVIGAALVLASTPALAQWGPGPAFAPPGGGPHGFKGPGKGHPGLLGVLRAMADEIGLSEKQRSAIREIVEEGREEIVPLRKQAAGLRAQMRELLAAEKLDKKKIEATHDEIQAVHQTIADIRFHMVLDALEVLTAQQRTELFTLLGQCKGAPGGPACQKLMKGKGPKWKKGKGKAW
jgi:Spy/CpxP family protein refolding chaperone